jgi:hypothetical protein
MLIADVKWTRALSILNSLATREELQVLVQFDAIKHRNKILPHRTAEACRRFDGT